MTVDKDIMLYGVALFGSGYGDYSVTLKILNNNADDGSVLATNTGAFTSLLMESETDSPYYGFDVLFDVPVTLRKDVNYSFKASIEGPASDVQGGVGDIVECAGVLFNFHAPYYEEEDEDFLRRQIAEVLFKLKD